MSLLLVVNGPGGQTTELNLATGKLPVSFGRKGGSADIQVDDSQLSRKHCEVICEDDEYIIKDLNSSNGTWVNGADCGQAILNDGDVINIGGSSINVKALRDRQDDPLIGRQLGAFLIHAVIGQGSQASVFRGMQVNLDRPVALKIMRNEKAQAKQVEAFLNEAREAGRLNHPHVVQAHDVFNEGDLHVLVMELMEGGSTLEHLQLNGPLSYEDAIVILQHIGEAIHYAQENKIVHRDVKPANILSTQNGIYKLADLGIATRLKKGTAQDSRMHGTPLYMSPEQARGDVVDTRTDIYCLGASIWHLITGAPIFAGAPREVVAAQMHREVPNLQEILPDLNPGLAELITSMVAKEPSQRPASGREVAQRAEAFAGSAQLAGKSGPGASGRRRVSRARGGARRSGRSSARKSTRRRTRRRK